MNNPPSSTKPEPPQPRPGDEPRPDAPGTPPDPGFAPTPPPEEAFGGVLAGEKRIAPTES